MNFSTTFKFIEMNLYVAYCAFMYGNSIDWDLRIDIILYYLLK